MGPAYKAGAFGRNMLRIRRSRGVTQDELERLTGYDQGYLSRLERGVIKWPAVPVAVTIAQALGCAVEELLVEEDDTAAWLLPAVHE